MSYLVRLAKKFILWVFGVYEAELEPTPKQPDVYNFIEELCSHVEWQNYYYYAPDAINMGMITRDTLAERGKDATISVMLEQGFTAQEIEAMFIAVDFL